MPRPISNSILHLCGLIPMNRTVVLLSSCLFFEKSCYKRLFPIEMLVFWDSLVGGHVLVVSPITCGISNNIPH